MTEQECCRDIDRCHEEKNDDRMADMQQVAQYGADDDHQEGIEEIKLKGVLAAKSEKTLDFLRENMSRLCPFPQIYSDDEHDAHHSHRAEQPQWSEEMSIIDEMIGDGPQ